MGLGRWNRAVRLWERALRELKQLGNLANYARSLTYVGRFYLEKGDIEETKRILAEADAIARDLGGTTLIGTIAGLMQRVESQSPRPSTSLRPET